MLQNGRASLLFTLIKCLLVFKDQQTLCVNFLQVFLVLAAEETLLSYLPEKLRELLRQFECLLRVPCLQRTIVLKVHQFAVLTKVVDLALLVRALNCTQNLSQLFIRAYGS